MKQDVRVVQLKLPHFLKAYDMSRTTVWRYINRAEHPFPADKIGNNWYVNIDEYEKWKKEETRRNGGVA